MRKILFVMVAALAFVACEKDFQPTTEMVDLENVVQSNKVSLNQALVYAENSINGIGTSTRSTTRKVKSTEIFVAKPSTRSAESEEVSFYLINYENNEGFAMISTDSRTTPIYAYSDEGNINPADFENNPGLKIFLEGAILNYEDEIANCSTYALGDRLPIELPDTLDDPRPIYVDGIFCYVKTDTTRMFVDKLLTTAWHQDWPYNFYCDGTDAVGCGPTALAQIMAHHRYPASHQDSQFGLVTYDWDLMRSNIRTEIGHDPDDATEAIAILMRQIGRAANADYGLETYTNEVGIRNALTAFGYTSSNPSDLSFSIMKSEVDANRPIYITGHKPVDGKGHAWVIDGYDFTERAIKYYHSEPPYNLYKRDVSTTKYFHCNWGNLVDSNGNWVNGFYLVSGFTYTLDNEMIYNIMPNI